MTYRFQSFEIPDGMLDGLTDYIVRGVEPGGFLMAVLCNDLREAVGRADFINIGNLPAYVAYLYAEAPATCWGSKERVTAWLDRHRNRPGEQACAT